MQDAASRSDLMGATGDVLQRLSPDMRDLLRELLLHKSIFVGESFVALATKENDEEDRKFRRVFDETVEQGLDASLRLEEWDNLPHDREKVEAVAKDVRKNLLDALIVLKELSTEAFLAAAMAAPTRALREDIVRLADIDRQHADDLRAIVGTSTVSEKLRAEEARDEGDSYGAHAGRYTEGTLGRSIEKTLQKLAVANVRPVRLVISSTGLRHLRDEGLVHDNHAFGIAIDVELGWGGEAFAVMTRERVSLAEIYTSQATNARSDSDPTAAMHRHR